MKKYISNQDGNGNVYYVGETSVIKAMYKSIARCETTDITPMFSTFPRFSDAKQVYALCIDEENRMSVVNSDTFLVLLLSNCLTEFS